MWFARLFGGRDDDSEPSAHPPRLAANAPKAAPTGVRRVTSKVNSKPQQVTANKGFDPYNSGSFDKHKAWERVTR